MGAAADLPWSTIAAQAAGGATLRELSEHWGVPLGTLQSRSATEGWKKKMVPIQQNPTERAVSLMHKLDSRSKLRAAKVGDNTLKAIQRKKDDSLIAAAPAFKQTVDALAKVHQWDQQPQSLTQVNINLTGVKLPIRD